MGQNFHPPSGKLVNIGSHRLHLHAAGEGSPTVVLESGGASWSLDWVLVQTEIARFTRVCSYDRAGFGWSEPGPAPRTSQQMVSELDAMHEDIDARMPTAWKKEEAAGKNMQQFLLLLSRLGLLQIFGK